MSEPDEIEGFDGESYGPGSAGRSAENPWDPGAKVDLIRDILWVYSRLAYGSEVVKGVDGKPIRRDRGGYQRKTKVPPRDAPSAGAYWLLNEVLSSAVAREQYLKVLLPKALPTQRELERREAMLDDGRELVLLLERIAVERSEGAGNGMVTQRVGGD